jgi:hypothetical protein
MIRAWTRWEQGTIALPQRGTDVTRRKYQAPPRDILHTAGPPVRVRDVATWAGFSKDKVLDDARRGELTLTWRRCGQQLWAYIDRREALRYLTTLCA